MREETEEPCRQGERKRLFRKPIAKTHRALFTTQDGVRNAANLGMSKHKHPTETIVAATGTIAGAVVGAIAGPVGAVAGAIVGGAAGVAAGAVIEREEERAWQHDEKLDEEIGVYDGTLGAAPPNAPPARIGAFSAGSSGAGARPSEPPASGPIPEAEK